MRDNIRTKASLRLPLLGLISFALIFLSACASTSRRRVSFPYRLSISGATRAAGMNWHDWTIRSSVA